MSPPGASLLSRLLGPGKSPLRLIAVPRDHVAGDRRTGEAILTGRLPFGALEADLRTLEWGALGGTDPLARHLEGFSWLRDLAAAASRDKGARLAEALVGRWLHAHAGRADAAWAPELWGERILFSIHSSRRTDNHSESHNRS